MLRARWSRSECIIKFPIGKDAGQRLRNVVAECLIIYASSFLVL